MTEDPEQSHPYNRGYWYCDRLFKAGRTLAQIEKRLTQLRGPQFKEGFADRLSEYGDPVFGDSDALSN